MDGKKLRMSNGKFMAIWIPIVSFFVVLVIAALIAGSIFGIVLDTQLGRGKRVTVVPEGRENWDAEYYEQKYTNYEDSRKASLDIMEEVGEGGMILLKNDGTLPIEKNSAVTPFGHGYAFPVYNSVAMVSSIKQTFPGRDYVVTPQETLGEHFTVLDAAAKLQPDSDSAANYPDSPTYDPSTYTVDDSIFVGGSVNDLRELSVEAYDELSDADVEAMKNSTGLVFVSRYGNENNDKRMEAYDDGTPHYLALSKNEKDMIRYAKEHCGKVVLVLVSCGPMELDPVVRGELEVNAIVWAGNPGDTGFAALGRILCGDVNPSGRTVDIFSTDFTKDPSYNSYGDFRYTGTSGNVDDTADDRMSFVEYREGVYMGYRYYETASDIDALEYGELDGKGAVKTPGAVVYPFGYGLSYTTFDQEIVGFDTSGDDITVSVKITNTGKVKGRDVVQIYYGAPYTSLDESLKIEKSTVNLISFGKTADIEQGDDTTINLTFRKEDMASYAYKRDNGDGTHGCYMLEEGDYTISVRANSHDVYDSDVWHNGSTIWYDNSNPRNSEMEMQSVLDDNGGPIGVPKNGDEEFRAATNLFDYESKYIDEYVTSLTRTNWSGTFPQPYENRERTIPEEYAADLGRDLNFDPETNAELGNVKGSKVYTETMPKQKAEKTLTVADMRGKDYNDESWDILLDQLDFEADKTNISQVLGGENYFTERVESIELVPSAHCEGANGVRMDNKDMMDVIADATTGGENLAKTASFGSAPNFASTWDLGLLERVGQAMGQEALVCGLNGRYSPAFNLHRSPFIGRINEYFSEDPILSGKVATAFVNGTASAGLTDYVKHFGLNDQETNRTSACTWATEQTIREIYNKPFELVMRDARKTVKYTSDTEGNTSEKVMRGLSGMMISQNRVGTTRGFFHYNLVTELVRNEWGFDGHIITDMFTLRAGDVDQMVRAGTDSWLAWSGGGSLLDYDSATSRTAMREALHHVAFTVANSNALQNSPPGTIIYYTMSPWRIALIIVSVVVFAIAAAMVVLTVLRVLHSKKHPELYRSKNRDNA